MKPIEPFLLVLASSPFTANRNPHGQISENGSLKLIIFGSIKLSVRSATGYQVYPTPRLAQVETTLAFLAKHAVRGAYVLFTCLIADNVLHRGSIHDSLVPKAFLTLQYPSPVVGIHPTLE